MKSKKALGVVIATSLFLVVAIVATIGFQMWFNTYSSQNYANVEDRSSQVGNLKVETLLNNFLYVSNNFSSNITILEIHDSENQIICSFNGNRNINSDGLVAWWTFDEIINDSGTLKVLDYSGNNNDGILYDNDTGNSDGNTLPSLIPSLMGNAMEFDGIDDYVQIPNSQYILSEDITGLTFYAVANYYYLGTGFPGIMSSYQGPAGTGLALKVVWTSGFQFRSYGIGVVAKDNSSNLYERNVYVGTWNTTKGNLYVNSDLIDSDNNVFSNYTASTNLVLGRDYSNMGPTGIFMNGSIDEIRIYNRSLSEEEINELYWYSINSQNYDSLNKIDVSSCNITEGETYEVVAFTPTSSIQQKVVAK